METGIRLSYDYVESILGKPLVLGETDCNTIAANLLFLYHGVRSPLDYISALRDAPRQTIRGDRAVHMLANNGFLPTIDHPREGDFIIQEGRFYDEVAFVLNSSQIVTCTSDDRTVKIVHPSQVKGIIYRCHQ